MTVICRVTARDAPCVATLSGRPGNSLSVAAEGGVVAGGVHVYGVHLLGLPVPFAEIGGLVVDARSRRQGVGKALMTEAEAWAQAHGYGEVRLRSGQHRTEAHEFYRRIGYALTKTSHLFCNLLCKTMDSMP